MKVHVSTIFGTAPELIAAIYFCTTITYYFPVILLWFEVNLNSLRVDFILFRNYMLWLTNSGLNSSIGIWSRFWSLFSSMSGFTRVKQSLWEKAVVIVFLILIFCCYLVLVVRAIYKYWCGVKVLPLSSISCKEKSRTTQMNCGRLELFSWSMLFTRLRTKLRDWSAF